MRSILYAAIPWCIRWNFKNFSSRDMQKLIKNFKFKRQFPFMPSPFSRKPIGYSRPTFSAVDDSRIFSNAHTVVTSKAVCAEAAASVIVLVASLRNSLFSNLIILHRLNLKKFVYLIRIKNFT